MGETHRKVETRRSRPSAGTAAPPLRTAAHASAAPALTTESSEVAALFRLTFLTSYIMSISTSWHILPKHDFQWLHNVSFKLDLQFPCWWRLGLVPVCILKAQALK